MEQTNAPATYDYRRYDQVWQRVSPQLDPYPGPAVPAMAQSSVPPASPALTQPSPQPVAQLSSQPVAQLSSQPVAQLSSQPAAQPSQRLTATLSSELSLPGAQADPCCMGSAAAESLEVLQGFIEEELADRRHYLAFARQAPAWLRPALRTLADEELANARLLLSAYYLITGQCYRPMVSCGCIRVGSLCPALRERYHAEACSAMNYTRAAEGTTDPCLIRLLNRLSQEESRHAEQLMALLERAMR